MSCVLSNSNRFYTALEASYGQVPAITAANRIPAVKLAIRQQLEVAERKDKTGSRTFVGLPPGGRRRTTFQLTTYMTSWDTAMVEPAYGPLFQASLGGDPLRFAGGTAAAGSNETTIRFAAAHGLVPGQAVAYAGEIRFVTAIVDDAAVQVNAPYSIPVGAGAPLGPTVTYVPGTQLGSVSVFDYWSPASAVQRILCGGAVQRMIMRLNGDFHEFEFQGQAQALVDNTSFSGGIGQLRSFPEEPQADAFDYSIVPGHVGQAWLGSTPDQIHSITGAAVALDNDVDLRGREFGSTLARCIAPGRRKVSASLSLVELDDAATRGLYQAAAQESPIGLMFQLGEQPGQLTGIYLKSAIPDVPEFDDGDTRLEWRFRETRAQGTVDDEIAVAFA